MLRFDRSGRNLATLSLQTRDLCMEVLVLLRVEPFFVPIEPLAIFSLAAFGRGFQDEFSNVLSRRDSDASVSKLVLSLGEF